MAALEDILTAAQNIVRALSNETQNALALAGTRLAVALTANTQVVTGQGRLCRFTVTVAGAAGTIHDAATIATAAATNVIAVVPATVGVYEISCPYIYGLVYKPGAGQTASIIFSGGN